MWVVNHLHTLSQPLMSPSESLTLPLDKHCFPHWPPLSQRRGQLVLSGRRAWLRTCSVPTAPSLGNLLEKKNQWEYFNYLRWCLEKAMAPHSSTLAWKIPWMEEPGVLQSMGSLRVRHDFTFTFHFHALEKEMATHSSVFAWRIPGTGKPGGLPSIGLHRVRHDWSDLA